MASQGMFHITTVTASGTNLSINNAFTSTYDNYFLVGSFSTNTDDAQINARLRVSGTDAAGGDYASQALSASNTSVGGIRYTGQTSLIAAVFGQTTAWNQWRMFLFTPALAIPTTAIVENQEDGDNGGNLINRVHYHGLSTAYDGITFLGTITGSVSVFGFAKS